MDVLSYLPKKLSNAKRKKASMKLVPVPRRVAPVVAQTPIALPGNLKQRLNALRRKHRMVAVMTGLAMLVGAACLLLLAQGASDWWFELPWIARAGFLLADLALLGWIYRRHLDSALRKRLDLGRTALMVEKKWPQLKQSLIASVELTEGTAYSTRGSRQLVDVLLQQARARTTSLNFGDVVSTKNLRNWLIAGSTAVLASAAVALVTWPASLSLLERIFLLNVPLPTKTIVVSVTQNLVVPVGSDVELIARAQGVIPTRGRVTITYEGQPAQEFPVNVQPDKPATFSLTLHNVQVGFKYSFSLNDGHGPDLSVTAKVPPSIATVACEQDYPTYTGLPPQQLAATELSLLPGGHLKITATATDPLKSAKIVIAGQPTPTDAIISGDGTHLEASVLIPSKDASGFSIHLLDQAGVSSTDETIYPITLVPDHPPEVKILFPTEEKQTITLRAKPVIDFDASDDYGIAHLNIRYQFAPPPAVAGTTTTTTAAPPPGPVRAVPVPIKPAKEGRHYEYELDVSAQVPPWKEGDVVNYWVEAVDNNTLSGPGITNTEHKQFTVISLAAKQAEIFARLKDEAAKIGTISDTTTKINNDVKEAIPQTK